MFDKPTSPKIISRKVRRGLASKAAPCARRAAYGFTARPIKATAYRPPPVPQTRARRTDSDPGLRRRHPNRARRARAYAAASRRMRPDLIRVRAVDAPAPRPFCSGRANARIPVLHSRAPYGTRPLFFQNFGGSPPARRTRYPPQIPACAGGITPLAGQTAAAIYRRHIQRFIQAVFFSMIKRRRNKRIFV